MEQDLIALEPHGGWRGNHIYQSAVALEWLHYKDFKLGGMGRVCHVRNVDVFDEATKTVFQFYGCY